MIFLDDLSVLMQKVVEKGIVFMISKGGRPGYYSLYFALHPHSLRLNYHLNEKKIHRYADEHQGLRSFNDIDSVVDYVEKELG